MAIAQIRNVQNRALRRTDGGAIHATREICETHGVPCGGMDEAGSQSGRNAGIGKAFLPDCAGASGAGACSDFCGEALQWQ